MSQVLKIKLYLVHSVGMQLQPWLQQGVVGVVNNFLASNVTLHDLACMRQHDTSTSNRYQSHYATAAIVQQNYGGTWLWSIKIFLMLIIDV